MIPAENHGSQGSKASQYGDSCWELESWCGLPALYAQCSGAEHELSILESLTPGIEARNTRRADSQLLLPPTPTNSHVTGQPGRKIKIEGTRVNLPAVPQN